MKKLLFYLLSGSLLTLLSFAEPASPEPLKLVNEGPARRLPPRILGVTVSAFTERLLDQPARMAAYQAVRPAVLRFPGGSYANFYNWRDGLVEIETRPGSSDYVKFWTALARKIKRDSPKGITLDDYLGFAGKVEADIVLVPNLETSSVEEQVAWFKTLADKHILPKHIELGNEFWIAMAGDPDSLKRWPDVQTSMAVMHRYEQALRPYVGPGAKFAVQASPGAFIGAQRGGPGATSRRLFEWNDGLKPEDWFEAVTTHLYPGSTYLARYPEARTREGFFRLLMARVDSGTEQSLDELARSLKGKEIWVTEWNPQGGNFKERLPDLLTPDALLHLGTRMNLAILRQPAVTMSIYFMMHSSSDHDRSHFLSKDGTLAPLPLIQAYTWFDEAANGGVTFQRVIEPNGSVVAGMKSRNEHYRGIEGAWFRSAKAATLILHNVTDRLRRLDMASLEGRPPKLAEALLGDKMTDPTPHSAPVVRLAGENGITLPALSVARLVWEIPAK